MLAKLLLTFSMVCTIPEFHSEGVCTASTPPPAHSRGFGRSRERGQPWAQQGPGPTGTVAPVSTRQPQWAPGRAQGSGRTSEGHQQLPHPHAGSDGPQAV